MDEPEFLEGDILCVFDHLSFELFRARQVPHCSSVVSYSHDWNAQFLGAYNLD